ncbi:MAG: tyrosine-type recombinase/integrase [Xanthobacteraceae bacterium]
MRLYLYRRNPKGNWYIRGQNADGRPVFESTRTREKGLAEAIRIKLEGEVGKERVFGKKAVVTFDKALESYYESGGSPRFLAHRKTGEAMGAAAKFLGVPLLGITQSDLDRAAIEAYPDARPDTRNRQFYTPFVAVWNHAVGNDWADYRKWRRPKKPKGTNVAVLASTRAGSKPVAYEHASKFVLAMSPANAIVMTVLFYTGMRPIELFGLECENVDVKGRWISLPSSKTGEPRGIPIHKSLVPLMAALKKRGGKLVRQWNDRPFVVREAIGGQMKKALAGARKRTERVDPKTGQRIAGTGINDISPYTARHTVSTQLVVNGVHAHIKDQILGHAVDDMSRHYTNVPRKELIAAIDTLPTVKAWVDAPWMKDPVSLTSAYAGVEWRHGSGTRKRKPA